MDDRTPLAGTLVPGPGCQQEQESPGGVGTGVQRFLSGCRLRDDRYHAVGLVDYAPGLAPVLYLHGRGGDCPGSDQAQAGSA